MNPDDSRYENNRGVLTQTQTVGDLVLTIRAEAIRQERTGIHARLTVMINGVALAWSNFNVEKDEERVRLTNSAHKHLNGAAKDYPAAYLKKDIDNFVYGLWDAYVRSDLSERVAGSAHPDPPTPLVGGFLIEGGGTILFGPPERGKSWVLLLMAVCLDAGLSTLWPVQASRPLFINLERSAASIRNRLGAVNRALGLPSERSLEMMNRRGRSLSDIEGSVEESIREREIDVVILDSITRAGAGDLTENAPANRTIDMMNNLCPSWIGVAHTPRNDDTHLYGSQMFDAGADITVRTLSELREDERAVGMIRTKGNDLPAMREPEVIALRFEAEAGLIGARRAHLTEFPNLLAAGKKDDAEQMLIDHLHEIGRDNATNAANVLGLNRSVVSTLFSNSSRFVNLGREGKEVYYGVL